jgi:hypothetical protein
MGSVCLSISLGRRCFIVVARAEHWPVVNKRRVGQNGAKQYRCRP